MNRSSVASWLGVAALFTLALAPLAAEAKNETHLLKNLDVTGTVEGGGTFDGKFTVTQFGYDETKGFTVSGVLKGLVRDAEGKVVRHVMQEVSGIPSTLTSGSIAGFGGAAPTQQQPTNGCDILTLNIGAIHLDLLGLVLDLAPINLDLTAVPGGGNLLGNLLCAIAGLLNPLGFLDVLLGSLQNLITLLNLLNGLFG